MNPELALLDHIEQVKAVHRGIALTNAEWMMSLYQGMQWMEEQVAEVETIVKTSVLMTGRQYGFRVRLPEFYDGG